MLDTPETSEGYNDLLWQMICYSPKMPLRLQGERLLNTAEKFSLPVKDEFFTKTDLVFNGFKWGNGPYKVLITHGWGSKAADFGEIISALLTIDGVEVIAFDVPGNGSSESELSNLGLFIETVKTIIEEYGTPDIVIGHSLGAMANVIALKQLQIIPKLLISITPLIRLKENFEAIMTAVNVSPEAQIRFLDSFEERIGVPASFFNLDTQYTFGSELNHWLAFDPDDRISTYDYMKPFLVARPCIRFKEYDGVGHERILKSETLLADLISEVKAAL